MEEGASVGSDGDALVFLSYFVCFLHQKLLVASHLLAQGGVGDLLRHAEAVDEAFLLTNKSLGLFEFIFHLLQLLGQKLVLLAVLLARNSEQFVLLLGVD